MPLLVVFLQESSSGGWVEVAQTLPSDQVKGMGHLLARGTEVAVVPEEGHRCAQRKGMLKVALCFTF